MTRSGFASRSSASPDSFAWVWSRPRRASATCPGSVSLKTRSPRAAVQAADRERLGAAWSDTGLVFTSKSGLPIEPRNVDRTFARACTTTGCGESGCRTLRHTAATLLKALGVPPKDAQVILGHAHITTTNQIYTHVDEPAKREALSKLNRLLGGDDK
jgi:integrase